MELLKVQIKTRDILLSILLTVVLPIWSNGAENCTKILEHTDSVSNQLLWNQHFERIISPQFEAEWLRLIGQYDLDSFEYIGKKETSLLNQLGFSKTDKGYVAPTLKQFVENYYSLVAPHDSLAILPSLVLRNRITGEVKLVAPAKDNWPSENPSDWEVRMNERLSSQMIIENISKGRWPLFSSGLHDVYHLITFALNPTYTQNLRTHHSKILYKKFNRGFLNRSAYMLEVLTLANPDKSEEIANQLAIRTTPETTFSDFKTAIDSLPLLDLIKRAKFWREHYQDNLIYYAGGMAWPFERLTYARRKYLTSELSSFYIRPEGDRQVMPDRMLTDGLSHLDVSLDALIRFQSLGFVELITPHTTKDPKVELESLLRLQVARMEYSLWRSSTKVTVEQWSNDMLKPDVDVNSASMSFVRDVFGENSLAYRYMSGLL